jgi:hypothetical protein
VGKAVSVSKGSNSFKAFYVYTFNRNIILEAVMAPLKLSSRKAVVATVISAIADSSNELPLSTKTTSTPAGNRKHTEKIRSHAKQILQPHLHKHFICSNMRASNGKKFLHHEVQLQSNIDQKTKRQTRIKRVF